MSLVFNGVLASRETGSLMPVLALDGLKISDCTINAIKIDDGDQKITRDEVSGMQKRSRLFQTLKTCLL